MDLSRWFEHSYLNFFSIGPLIPALFAWLTAFFLLRIKSKSRATLLYGLGMLAYGFFEFSYFLASTIYLSELAFHRWGTVSWVLILGTFMASFFLYWPENSHPRLAGSAAAALAIISLATIAYFFVSTAGADKVYQFAGHYRDFRADRVSETAGRVILLYIVIIGALGIWRGVVSKRVRWAAISMGVAWYFGVIIPGVLNVLSRQGAIGFDMYQISKSLMVLSAFFTIFVLYLNWTEDRTTFMTKLVAISAATFLVVFQLIAYVMLSRYDIAYDGLHRANAARAIHEGVRGPELRYVAAFSPGEGEYRFSYRAENAAVELQPVAMEHSNTFYRERIVALGSDLSAEEFQQAVAEAPPELLGYRMAMESFLADPERKLSPAAYLDSLTRPVLTRRNKIAALPDEGFRDALSRFVVKETGVFSPFAAALKLHLQRSPSEGAALKAEILQYLQACLPAGARNYRWHALSDPAADPYVSYVEVDLNAKVVHEVGFSYIGWRKFMHDATAGLTTILLLTIVVLLTLFPLFFFGALVKPLRSLLSGVQQVNEGDLNVEVPVRVEDEIGFLARSFNGMVRSIQSARKRLQEYAETLEEKVKERTSELRNSLDEVNRLKSQQDGDYWLTSMLIAPLSAKRASSDTVKVDFLIKQKKEFQFRRWKSEIGGDFCASDRIELRGEQYTVFINADAMGKSIQGAGGTIVLGSVLESILSRTRNSRAAQQQHPERWLKYSFIEMHKIFESFDGSMLVSMVFGLLHEQAGFLYYLNAEHPASVLYRNRDAEFLEKGDILRKAGWIGIADTLHIETYQLQTGDVIIAGSDGRDDIAIGKNEEGNRIINEDETQFRIIVQEANADLQRIYDLLVSSGELTDDLSLIRVEYAGPGLPLEPGDAREVIDTARAAHRNGKVEEALELLRMRMKLDPVSLRVHREYIATCYRSGALADGFAALEPYLRMNPGDAEPRMKVVRIAWLGPAWPAN